MQTLGNVLREKGLVKENSLSDLEGINLCVDAHCWLRSIEPLLRDPWHHAIGGTPLSLTHVIDEELKKFSKSKITPLFIFNGINIQVLQSLMGDSGTKGPTHQTHSSLGMQGLKQYTQREDAWKAYENKADLPHKNAVKKAQEEFLSAGTNVGSSELVSIVINHLRQRKVQFFRAPYLALAQAAWLTGARERQAHCAWGSDEMLLFMAMTQSERLILNINFEKQSFEWVSLIEICDQHQISTTQFIDACIIMTLRHHGFLRGVQGFPQKDTPTDANQLGEDHPLFVVKDTNHSAQKTNLTFDKVIQVMKQQPEPKDLIALIDHFFTADSHLTDTFCKIQCVIRHHIVLSLEHGVLPISYHNTYNTGTIYDGGREKIVNPYNTPLALFKDHHIIINKHVPRDLHVVFGPRLPHLVYVFLSHGILSPQVLNNVVHNLMVESLPSIDTVEYRDLLQKIVPLRTQIAYLLIFNFMTRDEAFWRTKHCGGSRAAMSCLQWHQEIPMPLHTPPDLSLDDWAIEWDEKEKNKNHVLNFKTVMVYASNAYKATTQRKKMYTCGEEVMCAILLKVLDLLGYFTHPQMQQPLGEEKSGKSVFAEVLEDGIASSEYAEKGVLFIELLRTNALNANLFTYKTNPRGQDLPDGKIEDPRNLLISRVFSILSCNMDKSQNWRSDIVSRDLCAFNVLVKSLHRTLRSLSEVVFTLLYLDEKVPIKDVEPGAVSTLLKEVSDKLPFGEPIYANLGVVILYILQRQGDSEGSGEGNPKDAEMEWEELDLKNKFPGFTDLMKDLRDACRFWKEAMKVVEKLCTHCAVSRSLAQQFKDAERLLTKVSQRYGFQVKS